MKTDVEQLDVRELDHRSGDGFDVTLLWSARTGRVFVAVEDLQTNGGFHIVVDPADALDAFHHPYAYSRRAGHSVGPGSEWDAAVRLER